MKKPNMEKLKIDVLSRVRNNNAVNPVRKSDFFKNTKTINLYSKAIKELFESDYLESPIGSDALDITKKGIAFLDWYLRYRRDRNIEHIRYAITTAIALAAFIKSFFF